MCVCMYVCMCVYIYILNTGSTLSLVFMRYYLCCYHSCTLKTTPFLLLPIGSIVVPSCGSYTESYKVIPKRNYYGASGYR